ncbi:transcriptional regulator, BadM/Rrf2 family [Saccharicrinis carchari]|uniref:Transcriptional regulator, BadM/Rrf2 family n=1 Tax=Saccharicrinis carchari TaxID=1168039 RepID=A0A521DMZ3_SACCC|nr:Rrf2 family transcriptional regulator [Saccharicrinis carchari]SMO73097.1 transcriptional regulator, BadM/Rrf2 family [Saccharicrinis carchari]
MSKIITLSEAASIALHGMVLIAKSDKKLNVNQISETIDSSRHHVAKVFQRLAKENFVSSNRGPNGGFVMKKEPKDVTLLELYEVIEGPVEVQGCPSNKEKCPFNKCIMGDLATALACEFKDFLGRQTLADYV